jgi:glycosidase
MRQSRSASEREAARAKAWSRRTIFVTITLLYCSHLSSCVAESQKPAPSGQHAELPWYVTTAAIHRMMLKPSTKYWRFEHLSIEPGAAEAQLKELRANGITAIEIFAPEEGGNSYDGLDAKNRYRLDSGIGSIEDFRRLVKQAHSLRMHVITFQNLGYSSEQADQFLKAADDERAGRNSRETEFFFWSDHADAPPPAISNSYFLMRPALPGYDPTKNEFWQWSERAQKFYWTRWPGFDDQGDRVHLPQYNWNGKAWPEEAEKVIRFWLGTGIDGMVLDAVNWYAGIDWQKNAEFLTEPLKGRFSQPEGGGAFHKDDPVGWITEGDYTNLFDYGLGIWWEPENHPLEKAVREGNP